MHYTGGMQDVDRERWTLALKPLANTRQDAARALEEATAAIHPAVMAALSEGAPELWLHKLTGVSRSTIRVWKSDAAATRTVGSHGA